MGKKDKGSKTDTASTATESSSVGDLLGLKPGPVDLAALDPAETPGFNGSKADAPAATEALAPELGELQERLYASSRMGDTPAKRILMVLQGMDTSGKGGVISHVAGLMNPQGLRIATFKKPTPEEREHDFLWRIRKQVPGPGFVGVFDRSHYEDVLIVRVDGIVPEQEWRGRYAAIRDFEAELTANGVTLVKCMLHISAEEQQERLLARLDEPAKRWKYNPGDVAVRARWADYRAAYTDALRETDTDATPWYVIPADRKWYRNWAIASLLAETLEELAPQYPPPSYDVAVERARVKASRVT
jgi:PPK2 family polyphosphate:nucleotide phosphotransferase